MEIYADKHIYCMEGDDPDSRTLLRAFTAHGMTIPADFQWDGASSPSLPLIRYIIPKFHHNLKASCRHDFACRQAKDKHARKNADKVYFWMLVKTEKMHQLRATIGYIGVRLGAFLGIGVRYPHFIKDKIWPLLGVKS